MSGVSRSVVRYDGDIRPGRLGMVVMLGDNTRAEEGLYGTTQR
jgi:hypothetical protein